ncbi:MAG TPA: hypothetical protein PKB02_06520 [Anaerohalosphaeraceae bacterium]|nr:hypothetical protein [Anaerohalosphaeraceae bacterium]
MMSRICVFVCMALFSMCAAEIVHAAPFQLKDGVQSIIYGNDTDTSPTGRRASREIRAYNRTVTSGSSRQYSFQKYDLTGLKQEGKVFANCYLRVQTKTASSAFNGKNIYVYAVKEDFDNYAIGSGSWSTAPGIQNAPVPPLSSEITIDTLDMADLYSLVGVCTPTSTSVLWYDTAPSVNLDDVLNQDDDDTLLLMFVTYDQEAGFQIFGYDGAGKERGPWICGEITDPIWAENPKPSNNSTANINLAQVSWTAAEPNAPGTTLSYNVYMGTTDPNYNNPDYGYMTLASATMNTFASIPAGMLQRNKTYYWIVDVIDPSRVPSLVKGFVWSFNTNNLAPLVNAGNKQYVWLGNAGEPTIATINLDGTVTDDGQPGPFTVQWTQIGTDPAVVTISPDNAQDVTLQLEATGTYTFLLTANDGDLSTGSSVEVFVGQTACDAAKAMPGFTAIVGDFNRDCQVNLMDFSTFAANWLECNSLAPCN